MKSKEALVVWAKKYLDKGGYKYDDSAEIEVFEKKFYWACNTSFYEYTAVAISVDGKVIETYFSSFSELLDELIEIASEN